MGEEHGVEVVAVLARCGGGDKESQGSNSGVHYDRPFISENHKPMLIHERAS